MVSAVIEQARPCADKSMSRITIISAAILEFCPSVTIIVDARLEEVAALMFVTPRSAGARFDRRYDPVMARATLFFHRHKPVSRRGLLVSLSASLVALSVLVGCGQSNEYAANPAPYEVPAAELARASSAEFKPLIAALLSLRAATKAMNDYRLAQPRVLDEAQQKKYEELRRGRQTRAGCAILNRAARHVGSDQRTAARRVAETRALAAVRRQLSESGITPGNMMRLMNRCAGREPGSI